MDSAAKTISDKKEEIREVKKEYKFEISDVKKELAEKTTKIGGFQGKLEAAKKQIEKLEKELNK